MTIDYIDGELHRGRITPVLDIARCQGNAQRQSTAPSRRATGVGR